MPESSYVPSLLPLLRAARRVVVACHVSPDGDAVAGLLALSNSLRLARWEVRAVSASPIPSSYRFLPGWEAVAVYSLEDLERPEGSEARDALLAAEAIVCLDCSDLDRLGPVYARHVGKFQTVPIVNIDHHISNLRFGTLNLVETTRAAVCELLAVLMQQEDLPIDRDIASTLLAGIVADTLGFRTPATSPETLRVAADLVERGGQLAEIVERIFNTHSSRALSLWGRVLSGIQVEGRLVWADVTAEMLQECGATMEDADHLVDLLAGVPDTSGAFLFSEQEGKIRVSIRTSRELDAASLAGAFGGGGHVRAAGCTVKGSMSRVRALLVEEARRRLGMVAIGGERQ